MINKIGGIFIKNSSGNAGFSYEENFVVIRHTINTLKEVIQPDEEDKILTNIEKIKIADSTSERINLLSEINLLIMKVAMRGNKDRTRRLEEAVRKKSKRELY
jgi:hypothetical protein